MLWLAVFTPLAVAGAVLYFFGSAAPAILRFPIDAVIQLLAGAAAAYLTHRTVKNSAPRAGAPTKRTGYVAVLFVVGLVVLQTVMRLGAVLEEIMIPDTATPVGELSWLALMVASCVLGVLAARQFLTPSKD